MRFSVFLWLPLIWTACIGTDEVDDPIVGESITISVNQIPLLVGSTGFADASYFDQYGIERDVQFDWSTLNPTVATIDQTGLITAVAAGQTSVFASYGSVSGPSILVNVVADESALAQIVVSSPAGTNVAVGESIQLQAQAFNILGETIEGLDLSWQSGNEAVLSVNSDGLVTGVMSGVADVWAMAEGMSSNTLTLSIGATERTGTFQGANGYDAAGSTRLFINDQGRLMLELGSNFSTDFALGTYIYLSNTTSGSGTRNTGLEIAQITTGGYKLFDVTSVSATTSIADFEYVVVLCKPATVTFGFASLN